MKPANGAGLRLDAVSHGFGGKTVVDNVDLTVLPGELVCLLGPSGCGKTTTLRIAAGLETPAGGRVFLDDVLVSGEGVHLPPEARHVGFLFQDFALFPHLDVAGNVEFGLTALPSPKRRHRAIAVLEQVGMAGHAQSWPHQLSGGQQQRVALARALAPAPRLMLLDEPFSGLDKRLRDQVRDQTLHVLKNSGVGGLMVTHDPEEAMYMADRIAIMRDGAIIQEGPPEDLYTHPRDKFVASFFGEVNTLPGRVHGGRVETPLGAFPAFAMAEGEPVEVVIRPEALTPTPNGDAVVTVREVHPLGASTLVRLAMAHACGEDAIQARLPGLARLRPGERTALRIDHSLVFVFPASPSIV